jgi:hypothetical protein
MHAAAVGVTVLAVVDVCDGGAGVSVGSWAGSVGGCTVLVGAIGVAEAGAFVDVGGSVVDGAMQPARTTAKITAMLAIELRRYMCIASPQCGQTVD